MIDNTPSPNVVKEMGIPKKVSDPLLALDDEKKAASKQESTIQSQQDMSPVTSYRWMILASLLLTITSSIFLMMTFSTVSGLVSDIYDVKIIYINSCVTIFLIT